MKRPSPHGRSKVNVANWPLRRKLALALAIPLLLAATLGGLRVRSDLTEAANSSSSAEQVTVLRPAVDVPHRRRARHGRRPGSVRGATRPTSTPPCRTSRPRPTS